MYFPGPSDSITALDAASGDVLWVHKRELPKDMGEVPHLSRHKPQSGDLRQSDHRPRIGRPYLRGGREDREAGLGHHDPRLQEGRQAEFSGPIIADGLAITGRSCEPEGGPDACVITAHDAKTGKEVWRTSTIARGRRSQ